LEDRSNEKLLTKKKKVSKALKKFDDLEKKPIELLILYISFQSSWISWRCHTRSFVG